MMGMPTGPPSLAMSTNTLIHLPPYLTSTTDQPPSDHTLGQTTCVSPGELSHVADAVLRYHLASGSAPLVEG